MNSKKVTVGTRNVTVDLICWKHYRKRSRGTTELVLDANPGLAALQAANTFLPVGTEVVLPDIPAEPTSKVVTLWD